MQVLQNIILNKENQLEDKDEDAGVTFQKFYKILKFFLKICKIQSKSVIFRVDFDENLSEFHEIF